MNRPCRLATLLTLAAGLCGSVAQAGETSTADLVSQVSLANLQSDVETFAFERSNPTTQAQASNLLQSRFAGLGYSVRLDPVQTSENVIVRIEGSVEPARVFIVGAHFDSKVGSPGADDNGTGLAAVLEIARLLQDYQPDISVELIGFALEEVGLVGSRQYAAELATAGIDVVGMISFDMIGYTCSSSGCQTPVVDTPPCLDATPEGVDTGMFIISGADTSSQDLQDLFAGEAATYVPDLPIVRYEVAEACTGLEELRRSDHAPFWDEGFDAMLLSDTASGRNPNYHQAGDLPGTLDYSLVRRVTQATLATIVAAAGGSVGGDPVCGDGVRNGSEVCDGLDLGGQDCTDQGFQEAPGLACDGSCSGFDTSSCTNGNPACSDGVDNDGDGLTDSGDPGCSGDTDTSEQSSSLVCDDGQDNDGDGNIDTNDAGCSSPSDPTEANCGDGVQNGSEVCDGLDLGGQDCTDQGFQEAPGLTCDGSCSGFDTSSCTNVPPVVECMSFDESDDYVSIADSAGMTLPSGDWTVGIYTRVQDTTGNFFQYLLSNNSPGTNNSFNLLLDENTNRWEGRAQDAQGNQVVVSGGAIAANGTWRMVAMRKTGSNFDLLYCSGGNCTVEGSDQNTALGEVNGGVWNIGRRTDGNADRYFGGDACYMFLMDSAMSNADLVDASSWVSPLDSGLAHLGADLLSDRTGNGNNGVYQGGIQGTTFGPPQSQPSCGNGVQESGELCDQSDFGDETCSSQGFVSGNLACTGSCAIDTGGCGGSTAPPTPGNLERTDTREE